MTLPEDEEHNFQQEFKWSDEDEDCNTGTDSSIPIRSKKGSSKSIKANFIHGTTVVFDSFSSEEDVEARNHEVINVSKVKNPANRFSTDFVVDVSGSVAAILNASTVAKYRIVDIKRHGRRKADTATTSPSAIPSFSSILTSTPAKFKVPPSDEDLVSSLVEAARDTPSTASPPSSADSPDTQTTNQLRKRCKTMLQQRFAGGGGGQRKEMTVSNDNPVNNHSVAPVKDGDGKIFVTRSCSAPAQPFFSAVHRPIAVQQALQGFNRPSKRNYEPANSDTVRCAKGEGGGLDCNGNAILRCSRDNEDEKVENREASPFPSSMDRLFKPSMTSTPDSPAENEHILPKSAFSHFVAERQPPSRRISSSDVFHATMTTFSEPAHFADTCFRRSSDEISVFTLSIGMGKK
jgi:hypothetical protein